MADPGLTLVTTGTGKRMGSIRLIGEKAICEGLAEQIFRSRQRHASKPMSDKAVYDWFAKGWSNGPLAIVKADATSQADKTPEESPGPTEPAEGKPDVPPELPIAAAAGYDAARIAAELASAVTEFASSWPALAKPLVAGIVSDVRDAVSSGGVGKLASLAVGTAALGTALGKAMRVLSGRSAKRAADEVAALGVKAAAGTVDDGALQGQADVTAHLVGQSLAGSATRTALLHAGRDADDIAAAVEADLKEIADLKSGGYILQSLESALAAAQGAGRMATFAQVEDKVSLMAMERPGACISCEDIDGKVFASFAAAAAAYPSGRHVGCLGRNNCRGGLQPVKRT